MNSSQWKSLPLLALLGLAACVSRGEAPPVPPGPERAELPPLSFLGSRGPKHFALYLLTPDATEPRELLTLSEPEPVSLALSPDGRTLAVVRTPPFEPGALELIDMESRTSRTLRTGQLPVGPSISWSPDSTRLVFTARPPGGVYEEVYVLDVASGGLLQLTDNELMDSAPVFSPDGRRVLYIEGDPQRSATAVLSLPADGSAGPSPVPEAPSLQQPFRDFVDHPVGRYSLAVSPDGRAIAYVSSLPGQRMVCVLGPSGEHCPMEGQRSGFDGFPSFSWDGRFLAFASTVGDWSYPEVYVAGVEGGGATRLTEALGPDSLPTFLSSSQVP